LQSAYRVTAPGKRRSRWRRELDGCGRVRSWWRRENVVCVPRGRRPFAQRRRSSGLRPASRRPTRGCGTSPTAYRASPGVGWAEVSALWVHSVLAMRSAGRR